MDNENTRLYTVNNFVYHELPDGKLVVQNRFGIVTIHEDRMIRLLKEWDTKSGSEINDKLLRDVFEHDAEPATSFFLKHGILQEKEPMNFNIDRLVFFSNHPDVLNGFTHFFKPDYLPRVEINIYPLDEYSADLISRGSCTVIFMNPYYKGLAKKIRDTTKSIPDSYLLMSYTYNNKYYIDSLYCNSWKNPCHLCHMGYIESELRVNTNNNVTYQQMIDALYHEDPYFGAETCLSSNQTLNILTKLSNRLEELITLDTGRVVFPEEFHKAIALDLTTKQSHVDTPIHWEMCDCYE